ncbi:hypothetical protein Huta_2063 [Halorhabdus utahensis DSM 12940]|uniref:Uncharacterized protein n=1 Tax=Halorhabdus utahensis (strain DSM 12940 / JCM 11049 / AX-2) TaxID=519442 RepID=C7NTP0_HALUD|nr:hypothetical protein Huta_2063 [Halorhabdus utahensis DSM 12940]
MDTAHEKETRTCSLDENPGSTPDAGFLERTNVRENFDEKDRW